MQGNDGEHGGTCGWRNTQWSDHQGPWLPHLDIILWIMGGYWRVYGGECCGPFGILKSSLVKPCENVPDGNKTKTI